MAIVEKHGCVVERFKQESMTGPFNKEVAVAGCKESQFYSLPFGQAVDSMY